MPDPTEGDAASPTRGVAPQSTTHRHRRPPLEGSAADSNETAEKGRRVCSLTRSIAIGWVVGLLLLYFAGDFWDFGDPHDIHLKRLARPSFCQPSSYYLQSALLLPSRPDNGT